MCRFTVYKGKPILIGNILVDPVNGLLSQSRDAIAHPGNYSFANDIDIN